MSRNSIFQPFPRDWVVFELSPLEFVVLETRYVKSGRSAAREAVKMVKPISVTEL